MEWVFYSNPTYGFNIKYPSEWILQEYGGVATDYSHPSIQALFTVYPSEFDLITLDDVADSYLVGIETTGSVLRSSTVINGVPAIQLSFDYFDTVLQCIAHVVYVALFDNETRLFELDSQVCEDNVAVTAAIFEEMRNSFKP